MKEPEPEPRKITHEYFHLHIPDKILHKVEINSVPFSEMNQTPTMAIVRVLGNRDCWLGFKRTLAYRRYLERSIKI